MNKAKFLVSSSVLVGGFVVGAMFAPFGDSMATEDEALSEKTLPVAQAAVNENVRGGQESADYVCPMTGAPMGSRAGMDGRAGMFAGVMHEVIAKELGMTIEELHAARFEGKSIVDLADEKGIPSDELVTAVVDARKAELAKWMNDGQLTQEQMETMLSNMETMMRNAIENDVIGPMQGHGGNMGRHHGPWWNGNSGGNGFIPSNGAMNAPL